jgi:Ferritin-like domain
VCGEAATPARVAHGGALSRRRLLGAAAAALPILVTGCKGVQSLGSPPPPVPDIRTLRSAIAAEQLLVARYDAMLGLLRTQLPARVTPADTTLVSAIRTVQADHSAHLTQLKSRLIVPAGSALALSPSPTPTASGLTGGVSAILDALEQAEQAASDRLIGQLAALPPSLAQLFASIAASEATHVPYLQAARRGR